MTDERIIPVGLLFKNFGVQMYFLFSLEKECFKVSGFESVLTAKCPKIGVLKERISIKNVSFARVFKSVYFKNFEYVE